MLGVTIFGIFLTPVFYYVMQKFSRQTRRAEAERRARLEQKRAAAAQTQNDVA
jgi:hypothetical protein